MNSIRDSVEAFGNLDPRPIFAKLDFLESDFGTSLVEPEKLSGDFQVYPEIDDFKPTILALSIIDYAYLSVVPLVIQIMLDFGYTLIVIIVAARLKRRRAA